AKQLLELKPDIIALAETSPQTYQALLPILAEFAYSQHTDGPGPFDLVLLSKQPPVEEPLQLIFDETEVPSIWATIQVADQQLSVVVAHPVPPVTAAHTEHRDQYLRAVAKRISQSSQPTVLVGDFNATPWSSIFSEVLSASDLQPAKVRPGVDASWP